MSHCTTVYNTQHILTRQVSNKFKKKMPQRGILSSKEFKVSVLSVLQGAEGKQLNS